MVSKCNVRNNGMTHHGGFYILTLPPLTDYIKKLDPHTPLTEQTNKLPYDAEWEFPRNRLKFCKYRKLNEYTVFF